MNIRLREGSGVFDRSTEGLGFRDDIRTVDKFADVLTEDLHLGHDNLEGGGHQRLLVYWINLCISMQYLPHMKDVLMKACQKQAVLESWESLKSLWRRISPANGERTSPGWEPLPGNDFPLRRTSRKTWESLFDILAPLLSSSELNGHTRWRQCCRREFLG